MIKYDSNTINEWNFGSSNVTKVYRNGVVRYVKIVEDYEKKYFTTVARTNGRINLRMGSGLTVANYEYIKYSTDNGNTWTKVDNVNGEQVDITVSVKVGDRVQWKGKGIRMAASTSSTNVARFVGSTAQFDIEGNIMSLLNEDEYVGAQMTANYTFHQLFNGCSTLINARNLILPKNVLVNSYRSTFLNCSRLLTAPKLPATTLTNYCYYQMFKGCTSLTAAPELPATTLVNSCYRSMFNGCTRLNSIKCLATDISATNCTNDWVTNVAASGTFTKATSMSDWTTGINGIPSGWTVQDVQ